MFYVYDFSWFEDILECGRVFASESCGVLMIGNNHEKDLISLLETLQDTTESMSNEFKSIHRQNKRPVLCGIFGALLKNCRIDSVLEEN